MNPEPNLYCTEYFLIDIFYLKQEMFLTSLAHIQNPPLRSKILHTACKVLHQN